MRALTVMSAMLLASCNGGGSEPAKAPEQSGAPVVTADTQPPQPSSAPPPAQAKAGGGAECSGLPSFVSLADDAVVDACFVSQAGPGFGNGSIIYQTALAPDAVIAFYRGKAKASGLADSPSGAEAAGSYAANDGTKRSIKVTAKPAETGSRVTLNYKQDE